MGNPIDYVIFDGLRGGDLRKIHLVEVKSGSSGLNGNERAVRKAVDEGRVQFDVIRFPSLDEMVARNDDSHVLGPKYACAKD